MCLLNANFHHSSCHYPLHFMSKYNLSRAQDNGQWNLVSCIIQVSQEGHCMRKRGKRRMQKHKCRDVGKYYLIGRHVHAANWWLAKDKRSCKTKINRETKRTSSTNTSEVKADGYCAMLSSHMVLSSTAHSLPPPPGLLGPPGDNGPLPKLVRLSLLPEGLMFP